MGATEAAKEIRRLYKARGWSNRLISVRADHYSMGSSVRVEIKCPSVPYDEAAEIAKSFQRVRYCEVTGEILSGGNMYVTIRPSSKCEILKGRPYISAIEEAFHAAEGNTLIQIKGTPFSAGKSGVGCLQIWGASRMEREFAGVEFISPAFWLACKMETLGIATPEAPKGRTVHEMAAEVKAETEQAWSEKLAEARLPSPCGMTPQAVEPEPAKALQVELVEWLEA